MSRYIDADSLQRHGNRGGIVYWRDIDAQPTADVVDRDKAQKEIDYWHDKTQSYEQTILKLSLNKADVVEVVRCKDCKKREHCRTTNTWAVVPSDDWFCADGEREEK